MKWEYAQLFGAQYYFQQRQCWALILTKSDGSSELLEIECLSYLAVLNKFGQQGWEAFSVKQGPADQLWRSGVDFPIDMPRHVKNAAVFLQIWLRRPI
jgi:hypothetical protein